MKKDSETAEDIKLAAPCTEENSESVNTALNLGEAVYVNVSDKPLGHSDSSDDISPVPVYATIKNKSPSVSFSVETSPGQGVNVEGSPLRKSYVPLIYRNESPEIQTKQQALNEQLKDAVKIKAASTTETDF